MIEEVLILGGTHGNEKTGIVIAKHLKQYPIKDFSFQVRAELANPKAINNNLRYIDYDFNRSFANPQAKGTYEEKQVKVLGEKVNNPKKTFVVDLHTTTSNMGVTYILNKSDALTKQVAFHTQRGQAGEFILETKPLDNETHFISRIADHGLMVEVGPVAQNYYCAKTVERTWYALLRLLKNIELYNENKLKPLKGNLNYYKEEGFLDFPRDESGELSALVHPNRQGRDYQILEKGEPVFFRLPDESITADEASGFYPIFINEAAYYEKNMAMMLCSRKVWKL